MPQAPDNEEVCEPVVTPKDILHAVHANNRALPAEGSCDQESGQRREVQRDAVILDEAKIATAGSPGIIDAKQEGAENQPKRTQPKQREVHAKDAGDSGPVSPLEREGRWKGVGGENSMKEPTEKKNAACEEMKDGDDKDAEAISGASLSEGLKKAASEPRHQDKTLIKQGFFWNKMRELEETHATSPEDHESGMSNVSPKELASEVNETCISGPPGIF